MMIRFLCPNGHKIHCEDDRAGKPAKCPRCGVGFRVPDLADLADEAGSVDAEDDQIEFDPKILEPIPDMFPKLKLDTRFLQSL